MRKAKIIIVDVLGKEHAHQFGNNVQALEYVSALRDKVKPNTIELQEADNDPMEGFPTVKVYREVVPMRKGQRQPQRRK